MASYTLLGISSTAKELLTKKLYTMKTKLVELQNGENDELFEIAEKSGAETGDLIYDFSEQKFHPVYRLGNTNICFEKEFQSKIHKIIKSSREKDNLPFE